MEVFFCTEASRGETGSLMDASIPQRLSLSGELTPVNFREAQDFRQ